MRTVFNHIGPYQVIRSLGQGGMAEVFLAIDTRTGQQIALKLVQHGTDREAREILDAEEFGAKLQKQFSDVSSLVPAVYEYGIQEESGYFFVAMEYLDGENLSELISRGPLQPEMAVTIAIELCRFLEKAHSFEPVIDGRNLRSLLHLDLKPRNVRITSAQQIKVFDFGIAKALSLSRKVTRNDFGSVAYLSPERLETGEVDAFADFWALGVVLHEMLSGAPPFRADDPGRLERLIISRRAAPSLNGTCPPALQAIVAKLLGPFPAERYSSGEAIREDLERFKAGTKTSAEEAGWPNRHLDSAPHRLSDDEATRRTQPLLDADAEKTRRTRAEAVTPGASAPQDRAVAPATASATPAATKVRRALSGMGSLARKGLLVVLIAIALNEACVARAAGRLAHGMSTRELDQLPEAWDEYDRLSRRSYLRLGTLDLKQSLSEQTSSLVERVIANYRAPSPTVREAQWEMARRALVHALSAAGNDRQLRAALRYCEGHLYRINGEAKKGRGEAGAQRDLTEAVVAFREAAELRPKWPDPFLGLSRTFIVGLEDVDRGADALSQAQKNGHQPNDRETALLGDGYRVRGNTLVQNASKLAGLPQERDYLTRAAESYRQALAHYSRAGNFADVPKNTAAAQRALTRVEERLLKLSQPGTYTDAPVEADVPPAGLPPRSAVEIQDAVAWA
jgi:serine/threonine protein kinase